MLSEEHIQELIDSNESYTAAYFVWRMGTDNTDLTVFFEEEILPDLDEYVLAICLEDNCSYEDAESMLNHDWNVLTDSEADLAAAYYAESSVENARREIPERLHRYFYEDLYIEDILEDRGSLLNSYDGVEYYQEVNGTTYYLYKQ